MTRLILVRHGKTDWNAINRIQGGVDVPLNAEGLQQARGVAAQLSGEKIDAIFSSELSRSFATAEEIARSYKIKVKRFKELNELNQGLWQGLLVTEVKKRYKRQYNLWKADPTLVQPPKGENIKDVYDRVINLMQRLIDKFPVKTVCIVSHEIIIGLIKCHLRDVDLKNIWDFTLKPASWEIIDVEKSKEWINS
jgi:broad specificity phosphatase PhoE